MFFKKYSDKKDGALRGYDMHSKKARIAAVVIMLLCVALLVICLFPIVWVFLASFKDLKDFTINVTILPKKMDFAGVAKT